MTTGFSGCPLDIVNEPFHGLIENGWHDTWVLHHMKHASSQANKYLSRLTQSIKHFPLHFHHFMPLLPIPNACQLASQGVPLILSASHFMASSKMDGMTLESFITWSMRQAKQTNISFTAETVNQAFSAAFSPFHATSTNTKRMSTGFSGCPLDIVNEPFHGLIENGWHDTWVLHHMKHASLQTNKCLFHCWDSQSSIFRCIFTISCHFY